LRQTCHFRLEILLQISPAQTPVPVVSDVTAVHDFPEQIAEVLPRDLVVCLEVVVQNVGADQEVTWNSNKKEKRKTEIASATLFYFAAGMKGTD
jgi:hypothetical protein